MHATNLPDLVQRAGRGDQLAWDGLVRQFEPLVRAALRPYRLEHAEVADVIQDTWLALLENLRALRDPNALPGWLRTTSRRRAARRSARRAWLPLDEQCDTTIESPEGQALAAERAERLWRAVYEQPARDQLMLTLIAHHPELTGPQLADALGIAANSVSSLKGRCFARVRSRLREQGITSGR